MDNKEIKVAIFGIIVVGVLMFFAGKVFAEKQETERKIKGGVCTEDKLCPNALNAIDRLRDYQMEVYEDSTVIFDGDRHVATLKFDSTAALDSLIMDDNQ